MDAPAVNRGRFISHFLLGLKAFGVLRLPFFQSLTSPNGRPSQVLSHPAVSVFERNPGPSGAWEYRRWREKEFGQTMFVRFAPIVCPKRADFEQKKRISLQSDPSVSCRQRSRTCS